MPADIDPSPITQMTLLICGQVAGNRHAEPGEIEVDVCAAPNGSYSLSARLVKPDRPPLAQRAIAAPGQDLADSLVADVPTSGRAAPTHGQATVSSTPSPAPGGRRWPRPR
jgi:hypothetical protein